MMDSITQENLLCHPTRQILLSGDEHDYFNQKLPVQAVISESDHCLDSFISKYNRQDYSRFQSPEVATASSEFIESPYKDCLQFGQRIPAQFPREQPTAKRSQRDSLTGVAANGILVGAGEIEDWKNLTDQSADFRLIGDFAKSPIFKRDAFDDIEKQRFVQADTLAITRAGRVNNQANQTLQADFARPLFNVNGAGVTVGVISDSYNFLGGAAADIASGDLPPNVIVLKEGGLFAGESPGDEGRAMMQLIHDVAPGAGLLFYEAGNSDAELAAAIRTLANAGANIIVDDIGFTNVPFFLDGFSAQAVNEVVARGVAYFSAVGNDGRNAYESPFRDSGIQFNQNQLPLSSQAEDDLGGFFGGTAHDFDPGPGVDIFQSFTLSPGESFEVNFQWDQPFASVSPGKGAANDIDIYVLNAQQNRVLGGSALDNIGNDPIETFEFRSNTGTTTQFNFLILRSEGAAPGLMRYLLTDNVPTINEFATNSPTLYGHPNAAGAVAVGAVDYRTPTVLESFSSAGPTPILFDPAGNRLPVPEIRQQPKIVAPNKTDTTFFIPGVDFEGNGFPNFNGTSAAAPNAAAVAALMLQVAPGTSPIDLYTALQTTAVDISAPGFDFDSGSGLIQADRAVSILGFFNSGYYLNANPDIASAVASGAIRSGLAHFLQFGQYEGRDPGPLFSNSLYLARNPDVAAAVASGGFRSGFQHFIQFGQYEGRNPRNLFDTQFYLGQNPDVAAVVANRGFRSGFQHFIEFGQGERRNPNGFFDANFYLTQNPDVAQAVGSGVFRSAYDHFFRFGQVERRDPSALFSSNFYLGQNPDVAAAVASGAFRSGFEHFFLLGRAEGRLPRPS